MSDYKPPLRDIRFTMEHVADIRALAALETFSHADPDVVFSAIDEAGRFAAEVFAPTNRLGDTVGSRLDADGTVVTPDGFKEAYRLYVEAGWGAVSGPPEWGGHGFPALVATAVQEMLKSANMALTLCPMLTHSAVEALAVHGSDDQRALYLEKLVSAEWAGTMCLTESGAGSDVGALRTRAEPADDGSWRISGNKVFITWGDQDLTENIIHLVLARAPDSPPGTKGISLFIVPKFLVEADGALGRRNDITCVSLEHKLGIHASPTCVLSFGENDGAVGYLVGEVNQGMQAMFTMMNHARLAVGLEGLAVAEGAYQKAASFALERRQGRAIGADRTVSSPIVDHPDVRRMLMTMRAGIEAMRSLLYFDAETIDLLHHHPDAAVRAGNADLVRLLTPVSKAWPTDLGIELTSLGIQIHGGMGYVEETGAAQFFRDARISSIYEGTNGIQAIDLVMRGLPIDEGRTVADLLARVRATAGELADGGLADLGDPIRDAESALSEATAWLLDRRSDAPNDVLAGASPYLRMFGTTLGGWLLGRGALAARRLLDEEASGDRDFLEAKLATAAFYCDQLLPAAPAMLSAVTAGARRLFDIDAGMHAG